MSVTLPNLLAGAVPSGVHRLRSRSQPASIASAVARRGWQPLYLDGATIDGKATFLRAAAEALRFPAYFGHNWDAFEDSLNDLAWLSAAGYVLLYDHAGRFADSQPEEWATALDILREAAARWAELGTPFYVLLRG